MGFQKPLDLPVFPLQGPRGNRYLALTCSVCLSLSLSAPTPSPHFVAPSSHFCCCWISWFFCLLLPTHCLSIKKVNQSINQSNLVALLLQSSATTTRVKPKLLAVTCTGPPWPSPLPTSPALFSSILGTQPPHSHLTAFAHAVPAHTFLHARPSIFCLTVSLCLSALSHNATSERQVHPSAPSH